MNLLEINLKNPIAHDEIIRLKSVLIKAKRQDCLIIDTGAHEFVSIEVIKYFRDQLSDLKPCLTKFKKIAMIHPPQYQNESEDPSHYDYFSSRKKAIDWFESCGL